MSTAGSDHSKARALDARSGRIPIFRWRAIGLVIVVVAILALLYTLFLDRIVESTAEEGATELLGTAVELDGLHIHTRETSVDIGGFSIADPFNRMRNLVEAGQIRVALEPEALLARKIVAQHVEIGNVRFGTTRQRPAPPVSSGGFAPRALARLDAWAAQYKKPILSFTPIDTIRSIVLDPSQLASVQAASALAARADSVKTATETGIREIGIQRTLDSAEAVLGRLRGANPGKLGIAGTRQAIADVKRTIDDINATKGRVESLGNATRDRVTLLSAGVVDVDEARQRDYAFARSLLKLPSFTGPEVSTALFGQVSIDRLQQALYWAALAKQYVPPGLLPRESPGPKRLRLSGTTVQFPVEHEYPSFAIQRGELTFTIGQGGGQSASYAALLTDLSSAPAITGKPTRFDVHPTAATSGAIKFSASGEMDHRSDVAHDRASARAQGVPLPGFDLPVLPVRVETGRGATELHLALDGDHVDARWMIRSDQVKWIADSANLAALNTAESLIYRILSGLPSLDLSARATGPLQSPSLSVSSNLDQAIGNRLKAVAGEEVAKAEAMARAKVDSIVEEKVAPVRARALEIRTEAERRVADARSQLDERKRQLEEQLKDLSGLPFGLPLR